MRGEAGTWEPVGAMKTYRGMGPGGRPRESTGGGTKARQGLSKEAEQTSHLKWDRKHQYCPAVDGTSAQPTSESPECQGRVATSRAWGGVLQTKRAPDVPQAGVLAHVGQAGGQGAEAQRARGGAGAMAGRGVRGKQVRLRGV